MPLFIVPFYASLLAALYIFLSLRVIRMRRRERVAVGDGNNLRLRRAIRVHANFAEYVPLALILLAFVEMQRSPALLVHGLCLSLVIGRAIHAYGVSQEKENYRLREAGMALTFFTIISSSLLLLRAFF